MVGENYDLIMKKTIVIVLSLFGLIHSSGTISQYGQCKELSRQEDFNITDFQGEWREMWHSSGDGRHCSIINVSEEADIFVLTNEAVNNNFNTNQTGEIHSINDGIIKVVYRETMKTVEYNALDSGDYSIHSILYTCEDTSPNTRSLGIHVLLRPQITITSMLIAWLNTILSGALNVLITDLTLVDHTDDACYALPVIDSGPIILPGSCDNVTAYGNFAPSQFLGEWHQIASYYTGNIMGTCARSEYSMDNEEIIVKNNQIANETLHITSGTARVISDDNSGILRITVEVSPEAFETQDIWILDTDYTSYAIAYACIDLPDTDKKRVYSWILGRSADLPESAQTAVTSVINSRIDLNQMYFQETMRSDDDCFYYPKPDDQPVVFRGICDQSIPVLAGFEPELFMGIWYNIESYPSQFQTGTCITADYSLGEDGVVVLNSQVKNERLMTASGYAIISDQEPGKLVVSFPIEGTNSTIQADYWVLDTDYNTYALMYTCTDLQNRERRVVSWKLSRSKKLTPNATASIEATMATIPVLDQRYFIEDDQTEHGCFFYPDPVPGVPVVFPGRCDDDIRTQIDFDLSKFAGTWYDVESYPILQNARCINHEFSAGPTNTFSLVSTQIVDQFIRIINATITSDPADNAKLTISLTSEGEPYDIPVWILSTDYDNYALAYSCIQRSSDFRSIFSWKLSRERTLTEDAHAAINAVIEPIIVLDDIYFQHIDHSLDGCFSLPELEPGEPVVLSGQCDQNVGVIQDFRPDLYSGTWRVISTYPADFQTGTCLDSTYTIDGATIEVRNTQVINEELDTITGTAVLAANDTSGKLLVNFPGVTESAEYWILDTDYSSYSLVYSCREISSTHRRVLSWKLSRTYELTDTANDKINNVINRVLVLNNRFYEDVKRTRDACFYYPIPDGNPVVFRGQCEDIPVMQGFDAILYEGVWHNIESFPSLNQPGECNNARYTLDDETIIVFNTEVINQTLSVISGVAYWSPDEPAKFIVNFPSVGNGTADYWILDTDYMSYSLVYTCLNDGPDNRRVWSWKLSRTKELLPAAVETINNVKKDIKILDDRYYVLRDQSPEACFYFPAPMPGQPVIFPGQCDQNITTLNDFNISAFLGKWHEIKAYPTGQYQGSCINHIVSRESGDIVDVMSNRVFDLTLDTVKSALNGTGDDGKFSLTIMISTSEVTLPFWIIDTDYEDYALAYSCVDNNDDTRNVHSWIFSRHRELSTNGQDGINAVISTIDVLQNKYYEPVDQSDDACFYFPDLEPGEPVIFPGQCDSTIDVVSDFNVADYSGTWRVISTYPAEFQTGTCLDSTYTLDGATIEVHNTQVVNEELDTITGTAVFAANDTIGKLLINFPRATESAEYWILDTDYTSYSLVYSCRDISSTQRRVISWKLSRTDYLTDTANDKINNIIDNVQVLHNRYYEEVNRTRDACFYYPVPDGNPVVFRGQCEDIPVMQGFDATHYEGLWHNIESFPSLIQPGECNNVHYTLDNRVLVVHNTEVINQTLTVISGDAHWSPDEPAKLFVNFSSVGQVFPETTDFWILDTDYTSYSLMYTCDNDGPDYRRVWSWKLSRTKDLPPAAVEIINNVKKDIKVLDERYYVQRDQSPEACFYFPEPVPGQPVIFPGQCDQNITTLNNFNVLAFLGRWHEIEGYPIGQYQGNCINHMLSSGSGDTISVVSNRVFDITLDTVDSILSEIGDNGKLTMTITTPSGAVTLPFWIIDTDYVDYALAYSCVDNNDNTRNVYSWKLSRSRELTTNGQDGVNAAISAIDVLQNKYYEPVDHSDDACFYFPELVPGEPVIFPGQCDLTIDVVSDFNVIDFMGRWRVISSYPSEFQVGTCSDTFYSHLPNGTIEVYNTEVVNQTLSTINGFAELIGNGILRVNFPTAPEPIELWVLDTDYTEYSLLYSCVNINPEQHKVWSWKLSRSNSLSNTSMHAIDEVIDRIVVLNDKYFTPVGRTEDDCFYFPEPSEDRVYFRGQCNENIPVVQDFNATLYEGLWYAVQSYPTEFHFGKCPKALYNLDEDTGTIDVTNTQVYNQRLDTVNATAVPASNGSAMLDVIFSVDGYVIFMPYWILATDYDNYALVYSCVNVNDQYMRVGSWKMSRQRNLSDASNSAIDDAMRDIRVVDQRYFLTWDNDEDDCFYYPELTDGRVILPGQCEDNNITVVEDFDPNDFAGLWHEYARFPSEHQLGECSANKLQLSDDTYTLTNSIVYNERSTTITGSGTFPDDGSGIIYISIDDGSGNSFEQPVRILETNYKSFALAYSCRNIGNSSKQGTQQLYRELLFGCGLLKGGGTSPVVHNGYLKRVFSWKLSRSRDGLAQDDIDKIDKIVESNRDLFQDYYQYTDQSNDACFYYPRFDELPDNIELPGPCDYSIRGVPSFDVNAFSGSWFETARYPTPEQIGSCSRTHYNEYNAVLLVTEVFNNTLRSINGAATAASIDGSGKLEVTFNIEDEIRKTTLYVIATDYTSYALTYSCRNLDNRNRIVSSWKLSRTSALAPEGNLVIDQAILDTQGLIEEYYLPTSQSDEDCFYVPEVKPDQAPLFRGQCEDVVWLESFDVERFLGLWHEIESYPRDSSAGDCVSSDYDSSNNQIHVLDTGIFNVTAQLTTGTVTADVNGRLTRIMNNGSSTYRQDIVVVTTDYENYALLYSCENYNDEYRKVWSAKYSRFRSGDFSATAQDVMAELIDGNDLLYPQFYQEVDQSDEACFHYPEQTGQQVILPGQCDENIPVQTNFDTVEYSGDWYQIERYPQPHEKGTCIGARYTVNRDTGVITVLKWEVIDDELKTIGGTAVLQNSNDDSAKMLVSLVIPGTEETVEANLYILSTDYVTYSLAYTCTNINENQRAVGAWKLSRTHTLTAPGTEAINALIDLRDELHQPYFISVEHNEYCKKPNSASLFRNSIIVTLLCLAFRILL